MTARDNKGGFTLSELLVAGFIFALILTAIVTIENSNRRLSRQQDTHGESFRAAVVSSAYLQQELRNAVILGTTSGVDPAVRLSYKVPVLDSSGKPSVNARGNVLFESETRTLVLEGEGNLVRKQGSEIRKIASLGNLAVVEFSLSGEFVGPPVFDKTVESEFHWSVDVLTARILASQDKGKVNEKGAYGFELTFFLRNQHPH